MPCYDPPITRGEIRQYHESNAKRILLKLGTTINNGPEAVRALCDWCNRHTPTQIDAADAKWWWQDHQRYDLIQSALAKLTDAEKKALRVTDKDTVG